ncbi:MAG: insulinase family protein [Desulfobacterales bacterium]|nr:insulinase family protein [Desulfobacterales bacterium]
MDQNINKTILSNGVRILTKKIPYVRSVSMGVWVNIGARDEQESENGLSHFIEHMLFKGTKKRTAFQIAKEFDAIGGQTNAFTSMEHTCYYAKVLDVNLEKTVDILCDIFLNSQFNQMEVENERTVILQEIGMIEDTPEEYVHHLLEQNFWADHPLGRSILGAPERVMNFHADEIKEFFIKLYQPDRIVISIAGNLEHNQVINQLGPIFESIHPTYQLPERIKPKPISCAKIHYRDLEQTHICLGMEGLSIIDPRRYACNVLNTILGGNMSSMLFQQVREQRGLAYSVYSFSVSNVDTGLFGIYAGVAKENFKPALQLIINQLKELKTHSLSQSELDDAIQYTKNNILLSIESTDSQMVRLAQNEIHYGRNISIDELINKIESVTDKEVMEIARTIFDPNRSCLTILGPIDETESIEEILHDAWKCP